MRIVLAFVISVLLVVIHASAVSAQGFFGKNKVQYSRLRWSVIETPNVALHFYPEERDIAQFAAQAAESICAELETKFNIKPRNRIPLIIYSSHHHMEQTNVIPFLIPEEVGGLTELIRGRVLVPHTGSHHQFVLVLKHELVHAFMMEKLDAVLKKHRGSRYAFPPTWFAEGLAEMWSEPWDSESDAILADAMLTGKILPPAELWKAYGTLLLYKEGHSFLLFLTKKYGDGFVLQILENWWKKERFEEIVKLVAGRDLWTLDREWMQELRKTYYPLIATCKPLEETSERMTNSGTVNIRPCNAGLADSADNGSESFVYLSNERGYSDINERKTTVTEQKSRKVIRGGFSTEFESFHPFQSKLSVNRKRELAFVSKSGGNDVLHILDLRSGKVLKRFEFPSLLSLHSPSWSPDGTRIVLSGVTIAARCDLYMVELPEGRLTRLLDDPFDDRDPDWSPDGGRIVFSSDRGEHGEEGYYSLFVLDVSSGAILQVTEGPYHDSDPSWSPDGKTICCRSDRNGQLELYLVTMDGGSARITSSVSAVFHPDWEQSGKSILFTGYEGMQFQIYSMNVPDSLAWTSGTVKAFKESWTPAYASTVVYRERPYKRRFGLDAAQSAVAYDPDFGSGGLGQFVLTDVLGNEQLYLFLSSEAPFGSDFFEYFDTGMTYLNLSRRLNYGVGVFRLTRLYDEELDLVRIEERRGSLFIASYPFSKFVRVDGTGVFRKVDRHLYRSGKVEDTFLSSAYLSLVRDTGYWGAAGLSGGSRFYLTLGATRDMKRAEGDFLSLLFDGRKYAKLFGGAVGAARVYGRISTGKEPQLYYLGGSGTLRGFERRTLSGTKAFLGNVEIRFPLVDKLIFNFPMGLLEFPTLRGAVFSDWGIAGDKVVGPALGSVGAGIFLGSGSFPVVRLDFARQIRHGRIEPDVHSEFSIGWNF